MRIEARGIVVRLGDRPVLDGVDLTVEPGRVLGLIGPNGAGKTTLLRALARLQPLAAGTILHDGKAPGARDRRDMARRLAYLAQTGPVHWRMRVADVVALGRLPHRGRGGASDRDRAAVEQALAAADVARFRERTLDTLSGGERLGVLLARALAVEGEVLLADEPTASLDPRHQLQVMNLLRRAAAGGTGIVAVLHDLTLAARFCDRLILLAQGRVIADGTPDEVLTPQNLVSTYGVEALLGHHEGERFVLPWRAAGDAAPGSPRP